MILASNYKEDKHKNTVDGWYIERKYDGVRAYWDQKEQKMFSRNGLVYSLPEFFINQLKLSPIALDGEVWFGFGTFDIASGEMRKEKKDEELWLSQMHYIVFDTPHPNLLFEDRMELINKVIIDIKTKYSFPINIHPVEYTVFDPKKTTIAKELKKEEDLGGEGLILRKPQSKYVPKRSNDILKVKSWSYAEGVVTGYNEGKESKKGKVGSFKINNEEFGDFSLNAPTDYQRTTNLNSELDWKKKETQLLVNESREKIKKQQNFSDNDQYKKLTKKISSSTGKQRIEAIAELNKIFNSLAVIGDTITFRYKETTKDGKPKMPTFVCVRDYE
jgi:DNA ligase-1